MNTFRYVFFAFGNGLSTLVSFLLVVLLARSLPDQDFVIANLILTVMTLAFVAGGGIDSAAVRTTVTAGAGRSALPLAFLPRAVVGGLAVVLGLLFVVPLAGTGPRASIVVAQCGLVAGVTAMALALVVPQARQRFMRVSLVQLAFYSLLAVGAVIGLWLGGLEETLLGLGLAGLVFTGCCAPLVVSRARRALEAPEAKEFWSLVGVLTAGTVLFALSERVDLFWVTHFYAVSEAADYGVAVRYAGGMALATGAFAAFVLPRVTAARSPAELRQVVRATTPQLVLIAVAAVIGAAAASFLIPAFFGEDFSRAARLSVVLLLQAPLVAWQAPLVSAFPRHGRARWCLELGALLVVVKLLLLVLLPGVVGAAAAGVLAHVVGTGYALLRYRTMTTSGALSAGG